MLKTFIGSAPGLDSSLKPFMNQVLNPSRFGRDENVSKMDVDNVDSVDCRSGGRSGGRPVEKLSLVDVDQENVRMVDVDK